jgi:uncharacterized protein YegP (UPF0339 family)
MAAKYEVFKAVNGQFYFRLKAANGEIILGSEGYSTTAGALNGVASVRANSPNDSNYLRQTSTDSRYYFVLRATNYEPIGKSQMYSTAQAREVGIQSVKTNGPTAPIEHLN